MNHPIWSKSYALNTDITVNFWQNPFDSVLPSPSWSSKGYLPWGSPHIFCLHFLFPSHSKFTTQHNILLIILWIFSAIIIYILLLRESFGSQNFALWLCSNVLLICILLSISLSSAASRVTYDTVTKSPFYTMYRVLVTCLLTQRNEQWA